MEKTLQSTICREKKQRDAPMIPLKKTQSIVRPRSKIGNLRKKIVRLHGSVGNLRPT